MSPELDRVLRETLADLAGEARPAALVGPARRRAGQIRRRRTALAATAAATAVALAIAAGVSGPSLLGHDRTPVPGTTVTPSTDPSPTPPATSSGEVPAGVVRIVGSTAILAAYGPPGTPAYVWNRATGHYTVVSALATDIAPAPTGSRVQVASTDGVRLIDLAGGPERRIEQAMPYGVWSWSPDGTRLAAATLEKSSGMFQFKVMDASSGQAQTFYYDRSAGSCNDHCGVTWHPNGVELVLAITDTTVARDEGRPDAQRGLQLFSATNGRPTRMLPVRAAVSGPCAWSPNGRYVVGTGRDEAGREQSQLIEVATGDVVPLPSETWRGACWAADNRLLVQTTNVIDVLDQHGKVLESVEVPPAFRSRTLVLGRA